MKNLSEFKPQAGGWYPLPMPEDEETRKMYIELLKEEIEFMKPMVRAGDTAIFIAVAIVILTIILLILFP